MVLFRWAQCRSAQPLLWDYASERLSEEIMERVEQHLHGCTRCHNELDSLKRAQNLLSACRAQEEPAPRSDWNDLQQRLVADGLAHIAPTSAGRRIQTSARRERFGVAGRAPWTLQLATSAVGGFAAVLILALGYNALHLRNAPGTAGMTTVQTPASDKVVAVAPSVSPAPIAPAPSQNESAQLLKGLISLLNSAPPSGNSVVADTTPTQVGRESSTPEPKGTGTNVNSRRNERRIEGRLVRASSHVSSRPSSFAARKSLEDKTLAALKDSRNVRHLNSKTNGRQSDAPLIQVASRYALEHVQPVGTDSDETNGYVVGSVRPIARDDEGVY